MGPDLRAQGFPVLKACVESTRNGYENVLGWIQVVAHLAPDGSVEDWSHDALPALRDRGVPFVTMAYEPTFFDAPFWPERPRIDWRADLFLCPVVIRHPFDEPIRPLTGVRWGFTIPHDGGDPRLRPLEQSTSDHWSESLPRLRSCFPDWKFSEWEPLSRA